MRLLSRSSWFACFLLLQVAGIGQLYPYIHLHHVHGEEGARVVVSVHPPSSGERHVDAASDDEHHHDADHVTFDCNLCQRLLSQLQRQADIVVYCTITFENISQVALVRHISDSPPLPKSQSVIPSDFRGPPAVI